jgi:hypothetical protein
VNIQQGTRKYLVEYGMHVDSEHALAAASDVLNILRDPNAASLVFTVTPVDDDGVIIGPSSTVDLWENKDEDEEDLSRN